MIERLANLVTMRVRPVLILAGVTFVLAAAFGVPLVSSLKSRSSDFQDPKAQNQVLLHEVEAATHQTADYGVAALVPTSGDPRSNPAAAREAGRVLSLLSAQRGFQRGIDYPATHVAALVSRDARQTLVLAAFASREESVHAVNRVRGQLAGSGVRFGGNDIAFNEINERVKTDLGAAETLAFPILLLLSFWVFRGLVAASLPLLVGGFAIVLTFLLLRILSQFVGLSIFAVNLVTGMGLGLGIDYSLFVLSRYREELAASGDTSRIGRRAAIARTLNSAGRTVLYGSLTIAGALACLLVFPLRFLYSMGAGGVLVALSAGAVALIVLPAVLVALGPRIDALAPARLQRSRERAALADERGGWFRLASSVMRRPGAVALVTGAALIAVSLPSLRLSLAPADAHVLPSSSQPREVALALTRDFPVDGSQTITMLVHASPDGSIADAHASGSPANVSALAHRAAATAAGQALTGPPRYLGSGDWRIELQPRGVDGAQANQTLIKRLRALAPPATLLVGGATAWFVDQKAAVAAHAPLALAILALVTLGFLFLMTGSLVLPLLALVMNLLTVAVGAAMLVLIFQDGNLSSLLNFAPIGGLEESNLVLLFVVAFALSTDYGVFLFSRNNESHERGRATRDAVAHGLERTGRIVTAAALLFCVAIGAFVTSHIFFVKEFGLGTAFAVAIDATIVRALLVPALMGRVGDFVWWAPAPLRRLHARLGLSHGAPAPARAPGRGGGDGLGRVPA
jgi:RND superfamily putative drug exporter